MTKLLTAFKRTFGDTPYTEPAVHFHTSTYNDYPEVCYHGACERPRLKA
jgi:hypothetical protein